MMLARHFYALMASTRIPDVVVPPTGLFYDTNTTHPIKAAWGLRALVSDYTGPLIRVRNTGTNAETDLSYDENGDLDVTSLPGGTYACTTIYDQSGFGNDLVQATSTMQPILTMNITHEGGPGLAFDGIDDWMRGAAQATNLDYMVEKPVIMYLGGSLPTRESFGGPWSIPNASGSNSAPFARLYTVIEGTTTLDDACYIRVNGNLTSGHKLYGINNHNGWHGHALAPNVGCFLQAGVDAIDLTPDSSISYPNATSMHLFANGAGAENHGGYFVELVVIDGTTATESEMQALLDLMTHDILWGSNSFYRITLLEMFHGGTTDGGIAELELRDGIGGTDRTYVEGPAMANLRYSTGETWSMAIDNNNATQWGSGPGAVNPVLHVLINADVEVQEVMLRARGDSFPQYFPKKWQIARFTGATGWQSSAVIDMTADGNSSGQVYVKAVDFV